MMKREPWFLVMGILLFVAACDDDSSTAPGMSEAEIALTAEIRANYELWPLPAEPAYPANNPANAATVALGRLLFFDPVLSGDDDVSCGHCHHPAFAWADGIALSIGVGGTGIGPDRVRNIPQGETELLEWEFMTPRNSPACLDTAYNVPPPGADPSDGWMFWDGREVSLEKQARAPLRSRDEMRHDAYGGPEAVTKVCESLREIPEYLQMFKDVFPADLALLPSGFEELVINGATYARAVAAYERELRSADSPYDLFARGDDSAMTFAQKRGLVAFFDAGCDACHYGPMFSDFEFYVCGTAQGGAGRPPIHDNGDGSDIGRFAASPEAQLDEANRWAFRTPTLRNASLTAPYFHTGGVGTPGDADYKTLRQTVEFFNRGGNDLGLDPARLADGMEPLGLTDQQIDDIVAFMESLTGTRIGSSIVDVTVPATVPSGLTPPVALTPVLRP